MRKKSIAGFFGFFFGALGVHRFYLGQRILGILYLLMFFIGLFIANEIYWVSFPFLLIPFVLGVIDGILFWAMPREEFDAKFNAGRTETPAYRQPFATDFQRPAPVSQFKKAGIERYMECDFEGALEAFQKALDEQYDDPATHFNMACCHANLEQAEPAFFHLSKAVEFGFTDFEKIFRHDALAWLRTQPAFAEFVQNDYRLTPALPRPKMNLLDTFPEKKKDPEQSPAKTNLLDQIIKLGELRDQGILTEEEFVVQKKKLLGQ